MLYDPTPLTATVTIPMPLDPAILQIVLTLLAIFILLKLVKRLVGDSVFIVAILFGVGILLVIERIISIFGH